MRRVTRTIKLKFVQLNKSKIELFEEMTKEATDLANWLLTVPLSERRKLTTSKVQTRLMSALSNQVIRHTTSDAGKKAKSFKQLHQK
ncbi:MAG: hypothetical protein HC773_24230 [Scytonema sp. CRU_2_7]|nr:hypothetical protein [Scytonema sp. CRU_2_7]